MKILIADDDLISRKMLAGILTDWGHGVAVASDGTEAWRLLQESVPELAILDWMMPGPDGAELCRRVRKMQTPMPVYIILLTSRNAKADIVTGLEAGANDYVTKPFDQDELRARVQVGRLVTELQVGLAARVRDLEAALAQVKQLQALLPICSYCRRVRDDNNYWEQVDFYIRKHSEIRFSHGICPDCWRDKIEPELQALECNRKDQP